VLGWVAERSPALVRRYRARWSRDRLSRFSHSWFIGSRLRSFARDTPAQGVPRRPHRQAVAGYRAASFSVTRASLWALDVLIDLGFSRLLHLPHPSRSLWAAGANARTQPPAAPSGRTLVSSHVAARFLGVQVPVPCGYFRSCRTGFRARPQADRAERPPFHFLSAPWEVDPGNRPRITVVGGRRIVSSPGLFPPHSFFFFLHPHLSGGPAFLARGERPGHAGPARCWAGRGGNFFFPANLRFA